MIFLCYSKDIFVLFKSPVSYHSRFHICHWGVYRALLPFSWMGYYSDLLPLLKINGSIMLQILEGWDVLMIIWAYYIPEGNLVFDCSHPWSFFIQAFVIKCCWKYCCHWALGFYFPLQEVFDNCLYCYKGYLEQAMNELYPFISVPRYRLPIFIVYILELLSTIIFIPVAALSYSCS